MTAALISLAGVETAYATKPPARLGQLVALAVYEPGATKFARMAQLAGLAAYTPPAVKYVRMSQLAGLATYSIGIFTVPHDSQMTGLVVYSDGIGSTARTRAWTFVLDGHQFYVLDLGEEGTFLFDIGTGQWCEFQTDGHTGWNVKNGVSWGTTNRIVGGDEGGGFVWELNPDTAIDEGFRDILHAVTGGVTTRNRVFKSVDMVRITGSLGKTTSETGASITLKFSDDMGKTWSDDFIFSLDPSDFRGEISWTSLGAFMAPGRIFDISDIGGLLRIDGADIFADNFDGEEGQ